MQGLQHVSMKSKNIESICVDDHIVQILSSYLSKHGHLLLIGQFIFLSLYACLLNLGEMPPHHSPREKYQF